MPDRIIRDELLESGRWLALKDNADRLAYLALLLKADAFGNFDAGEHRLLRLWRDFGISTPHLVAKSLVEMVEHGLVALYDVDGKRYLHIPRFRQRLRYCKRTYPQSPWCAVEQEQRLTKYSPGDSQAHAGRSPAEVKRSEVKRSEVISKSASTADVKIAVEKTGEPKIANGQSHGQKWDDHHWVAATAQTLGITLRNGEEWKAYRDRVFAGVQAQLTKAKAQVTRDH